MDKQKLRGEINVAIPYFLFYWAILTFYFTISHIISFSSEWQFLIVAYVLSLVNVFLLGRAGLDLRNKKGRGIILVWIFVVLSLTTPMRPVFVDSFKYVADIVNIIIAIYVTTNWKNWTTTIVKDNELPQARI